MTKDRFCDCLTLTSLLVILLEPIGLFGFAWTSLGPPKVPWIAPMLFSGLVGIANVSCLIDAPCHDEDEQRS